MYFSKLILQKIILLILEKLNKGKSRKFSLEYGIFLPSYSHNLSVTVLSTYSTSYTTHLLSTLQNSSSTSYTSALLFLLVHYSSAPYAYCVVYFACFQHFTCCMLKYSSNLACSIIMVPTYLNSQTRYLLTSVAFWSLFFVPF